MSDLLPRIESMFSGDIVLVDEDNAHGGLFTVDISDEQEDANGLPESLSGTILGLLPVASDYAKNYTSILRLIAEYAGANYSRGFRAGRLAEREERG